MAHEINLIPDVKNDMLRALKLRNFVFFIGIVISIGCAAILIFFGSVVGGQEIAKNGKQGTLNLMSAKLEDNKDDLKDYLTVRDQLSNLSDISDKKQVLSRTFNILSALLPTGADTITISELNVNLSGTKPTFSFDAQANAGRDPYIDYNVLDSFKKSMEFMYYDYGNYVDKDGTAIPAYCIIENSDDGTTLNSDGSFYALWTIEAEGCNPNNAEYIKAAPEDEEQNEENPEGGEEENPDSTNSGTNNSGNGSSSNGSGSSSGSNNGNSNTGSNGSSSGSNGSNSGSGSTNKRPSPDAYETELYGENQSVVRIWRTPQFDEWYENDFMSLDGSITGVPHFNSECITYSGQLGEDDKGKETVEWSDTKTCKLVPSDENEPGIKISDSSNGRGADDELVLRFSAVITFDPAVYSFNNTHVLAIPPADRVNVTDSYVQIQNMFGERARDCAPDDTACTGNTRNLNGGTN